MPGRCSLIFRLLIPIAMVSWPVLLRAENEASSAELRVAKGAEIYKATCASCHGAQGEGVSEYFPSPLVGDLSIGELAKQIDETMPEGEPEKCVGEDAAAVAAYMYQSFYSEAAQLRNRPPRITLARLTGNQLRHSLADLYAHFHGVAGISKDRGITGVYFDGNGWNNDKKKIERIDPVLDFDFGKESPGEGINAKAFYIYWAGSLKVDVTGRYEIIVRSTCSFVMNFGTTEREFIDNHVQSGGKTEFRQSVVLTAGRVYPFKFDFHQRERKTELPPASISLSWIPPHGIEQVIPTQNLIPHTGPGTFSIQSDLPPDDRSYGFERGVAINRQWDDSTTAAAIEFAEIACDELWPKYKRDHEKEPDDNRGRLKGFLSEVVQTAFRGPLDEDLRKLYIDNQIVQTEDDLEAIKRVVLISLKSPRFLYPRADQGNSFSRRVATRLALALHDSLPSDPWLIDLANKDELKNADQVRGAARRMLADYRAEAKTREMLHSWLNLSHLSDIRKNPENYPGFDAELVSDLKTSFNAFLDHVVQNEPSDYRQFFKADWSVTTPRIEKFYGEAWKPSDDLVPGLKRTGGDSKLRQGILTHPFLMSGLAYHNATSPIHRGVFLNRYILGRTLRPPNEAFAPLSPDLHPDLTTRERVTLQTSPESCQVCHAKINPLGFALENFDAAGRYRDTEKEKPIDSTGVYISRDEKEIRFQGAAELADFLANSPDAHRSFVNRAFQHYVKQAPAAFGAGTLDELTAKFVSSGFNIRELIVEIAIVASLPIKNDSPQPDQQANRGSSDATPILEKS